MKRSNLLKLLTAIAAICLLFTVFTACDLGLDKVDLSLRVKFVVDDEVYYKVTANKGDTVAFPDSPEKSGYIFDGWYLDDDVYEKPFDGKLTDTGLVSFMVYGKWKVCTHQLTSVAAKPCTCEDVGWEAYEYCSLCPYTTYVEIPSRGGHDLVTVPANPPSESNLMGYDEYVYCKNCDYTTKREYPWHEHKEELTLIEAKAPACEDYGWSAYYSCSHEGCNFTKEQLEKHKIGAIGHEMDDGKITTEPTCTDEGVKTFTCTRSGCTHTVTEPVETTGHSATHHDRVEANCLKPGAVEYWSCSDCRKNFADAECKTVLNDVTIAINKDNHTGEKVWSTQTESHHEQTWSCCAAVVTERAEHVWEDGKCTVCGYGCTHTGGKATCQVKATCEHCGLPYGDYADHVYELQTKVAATCCDTGIEAHYRCSVCAKTFDLDKNETTDFTIDKDPHNHVGQQVWNSNANSHNHIWSCCMTPADGPSPHEWSKGVCVVCKYECQHTDLVHHVSQAPTCEDVGWDAYDECPQCDYNTKVEKEALQHDYVIKYNWSDYHDACKGVKTCTHNNAHMIIEAAIVTSVTVESTCAAEGSVTYTATFGTENGFETQTYVEILPKHHYKDHFCTDCGAPEAGKYYYSLVQGNIDGDPILYAIAEMDGNFLKTTKNVDEAAIVTVAIVDGGYTLKIGEQYLEATKNGNYAKFNLVDNSTAVWGWNAANKVMTIEYSGKDYFIGVYEQYETLSIYTLDILSDRLIGAFTPVCKGHSFKTVEEESKKATCTNDGVTVEKCERCGGKKYTTVNSNGHNYVDGICIECKEREVFLLATFDFGDKSAANNHSDGSTIKDSVTTYEITEGNNTMSLSDIKKLSLKAFDAKGNSCIRLGTGNSIGSITFSVDENVTKVIICIAGYKSNVAKVIVNEVSYSIETKSDNGEYTTIIIDTTTSKTITIKTESSGKRCMIDKIEYYGVISDECKHDWGKGIVTTESTCQQEGVKTYTCSKCKSTKIEKFEKADHDYGTLSPAKEPTCVAAGEKAHYTCSVCKHYFDEEKQEISSIIGDRATGNHNYVAGKCETCGATEPTSGSETNEPQTVTVKISDYAKSNNWVTSSGNQGSPYNEIKGDDIISIKANGSSISGKYFSDGWRIYQSDGGTITISTLDGYIIKTVKITYNQSNSGTLLNDSEKVSSNTLVTVDKQSIVFNVGITSGNKKGQVKITNIEVVYQKVS